MAMFRPVVDMTPAPKDILAIIGCLTLASFTFKALQPINQFLLHRSAFSRYISTNPADPSWALVTGATHGIGLAFAQELCARGVNVILHGRNEVKLQRVKSELSSAHPDRRIETFVADAAIGYDGHEKIYQLVDLAKSLPGGGRLRILINNVGANGKGGVSPFKALEDTTLEEVDDIINTNTRFSSRLTTALMPVLSGGLPSLVINISSQAGANSLPFVVMYCATKAFNLSFSESMSMEMAALGKDIEVIGIPVASVNTADAGKGEKGVPFVIEPLEMARSALDSAGCGRWILLSHWKHWMFAAVSSWVPRSLIIANVKERWVAGDKTK